MCPFNPTDWKCQRAFSGVLIKNSGATKSGSEPQVGRLLFQFFTIEGHSSLGTIPVILFSSVPASEVCFCFVLLSEKDVSLEMYPLPAVVGVSLTLKCLAWGTDRVTRAVFYKDNSIIQETQQTTYQINNVTESTGGRYKCEATYTHVQRTAGPPYQVVSDDQDVFVQGKRNQHTALLFCGTLYALHTFSSSSRRLLKSVPSFVPFQCLP